MSESPFKNPAHQSTRLLEDVKTKTNMNPKAQKAKTKIE